MTGVLDSAGGRGISPGYADDLTVGITAIVLGASCIAAWLLAVVLLRLDSYPVAAALMALVLLVPFAVFTLLRAASGTRWALLMLVFAMVLLSDSTLRAKAAGDAGIDAQSLLKFAVWLAGVALIPWMTNVLREAVRIPSLALLLAFGVWAVGGSAYSITPAYTMAAALSFLGIYCLAAVAGRYLSIADGLACVLLGLFAGLALSLLLCLVAPDRALALMEGGRILRLSGFFGSPNNLGRVAALALMLVVIYWLYGSRRASLLFSLAVVPVALACLLLSGSRASLIGFATGLGFVLARKKPLVACLGLGLFLAGTLAFLFSPLHLADVLLMFSRSGRASELTTFTGRTEIWAWVIAAIQKSPFLGYGFASTRELIPSGYFAAYGWTTTSAHNMWLQAWVTTGILGLALIVGSQLASLRDFVARPEPLRDAIVVFIATIGLVEAGPVGPSVNLLTFIWIWAVAAAAGGTREGK